MPALPIAISAGPPTRACVAAVVRLLGEFGREALVYETDGNGGRRMEADILAGRIAAVLDLTLTELAAELLGLPGGAGPDRLTAAALRGVPQVIVPGGIEVVSNVRLSPEQHDRLGKEIANKASAARGATVIVIPRRGVPAVLVQSLRSWISPHVGMVEVEVGKLARAIVSACGLATETDAKPQAAD
jgi:uncharacterized protein (UPF0261 family)